MRTRPARPARGFTLLEVILATAMGTFLSAAIYYAIAMHYAQAEAGRTRADDAQTIRALARQLREDIQNVAFEWQPPKPVDQTTGAAGGSNAGGTAVAASGSGAASGGTGTASASAGGSATSTTTTTENDYPGGVAGSDSTLTLATRRPPRDVDFAGSGSGPGQTLRTVQYRIGTPQDGDAAGLVREEFDRTPDQVSGAPIRSETLAPEVRGLAFRYYDGTSWSASWDNAQSKAPYAIEATLTVQLRRQTAAFPEGVRKFVVLVPVPGADLPAAASSSSNGGS